MGISEKLSKLSDTPTEGASVQTNIDTYDDSSVVDYYVDTEPHLQDPEQAILDILKPTLVNAKMLDIGIGTGRTTHFFAPLVQDYVGVDYAPGMVEGAKKAYGHFENATFEVLDVRDISAHADRTFDVVVFSFNGLDSVSHEDRLKGLSEMHRVLKPGGKLVFSSHNILAAPTLFDLFGAFFRGGPRHVYRNLLVRKRNKNWKQLLKQNHTHLDDGTHGFKIQNYYIRCSYQLQQLKDAGFTNVRVFDRSGTEITANAASDQCKDFWLYFLCEANG